MRRLTNVPTAEEEPREETRTASIKEMEVKLLSVCAKCGGTMTIKNGREDHNLLLRAGTFSKIRPEMYVCEKCGFIEFYANENAKKGI